MFLSPASDLGIWELGSASMYVWVIFPLENIISCCIGTVQAELLVTSCHYSSRSLVQTSLGACRLCACGCGGLCVTVHALSSSLIAKSKSSVKTSEGWKFYYSVPLGARGVLLLYPTCI